MTLATLPSSGRICDDLVDLDLRAVEARAAGRLLRVTTLEFRLLTAFVRRPNQVLGTTELVDVVWGIDSCALPNRVGIAVGYLRRRFLDVGVRPPIETVRGLGYRYRPVAVAG